MPQFFSHQWLCLNPTRSFVANIGNDGSSENCDHEGFYKTDLATHFNHGWPVELREHYLTVSLIKYFNQSIKPSLLRRALGKIKRVFI